MKFAPVLLFTLIHLSVSSFVFAATCQESADSVNQALIANYSITQTTAEHKSHQVNMQMIRANNKVSYHYPASQISQLWYQNSHQQVMTTRYFDQYKRGIEYGPNELIHGQKSVNWLQRYHLISPQQLQTMELVSTSVHDCAPIKTYRSEKAQTSLTIQWNDNLKLATSISYKTPDTTQTWQLVDINFDTEQATRYFDNLAKYQTTDYADIGDDHTDPFLTKMVNLGFIEQGASGFYNQDGQPIASSHQH